PPPPPRPPLSPYTTLFRSPPSANLTKVPGGPFWTIRSLAPAGGRGRVTGGSFSTRLPRTNSTTQKASTLLSGFSVKGWLRLVEGDRKSTRLNSSHRTISYA